MAGIGIARPERRPPPPGYNQDEEIRRFQEQKRWEEKKRADAEKRDMERRRQGYRPEDVVDNGRGGPAWPYGRPYVGPRAADGAIHVVETVVPGMDRVVEPARHITSAIEGKPAPQVDTVGARAGTRVYKPSSVRGYKPIPKDFPYPQPFEDLPTSMPPPDRIRLSENRMLNHTKRMDYWAKVADDARAYGDRDGFVRATQIRNWHDQQYLRWRRIYETERGRPVKQGVSYGSGGDTKSAGNQYIREDRGHSPQDRLRASQIFEANKRYERARQQLQNAEQQYDRAVTPRQKNYADAARRKSMAEMRDAKANLDRVQRGG
jgi:hypothetical protein